MVNKKKKVLNKTARISYLIFLLASIIFIFLLNKILPGKFIILLIGLFSFLFVIFGFFALFVKVKKKYKIGIIPHYVDLQNPLVENFVKDNNDVLLINMKNYGNWHEIPDKINECDLILSSSLHGLIISDSYNIPNVWISFSDGLIGGGKFKFLDYFASVKRKVSNPIKIEEMDDFQRAISEKKQWNKINIDFKQLIDCCPFVINNITCLK